MQNKESHCSIFPPDLSALTLHILAMAFMFCDHLWATLAGDAWWLTGIGRLAFPMFAFFLVEGFFHTHDRKKYCMRLLLLAILSEFPINLMYSGLLFYPFHQNVIWTLLTGFLCIWAIDTLRKKCPVWLWIPSIRPSGWDSARVSPRGMSMVRMLPSSLFCLPGTQSPCCVPSARRIGRRAEAGTIGWRMS